MSLTELPSACRHLLGRWPLIKPIEATIWLADAVQRVVQASTVMAGYTIVADAPNP
ncbi:hypothetical protein [Methylomonas sp. LWB]|uniref:hypothetical protein n=1 Tax=Methylomonas sp. LWB TaxID=1905845 RepID=UPI0015877FB8|nr:hypothetical protein [Methylomonas sp. LWB]